MTTENFIAVLTAYAPISIDGKPSNLVKNIDSLCREISDNMSGNYDNGVTKKVIENDENLTVCQKTIAYKILNFSL